MSIGLIGRIYLCLHARDRTNSSSRTNPVSKVGQLTYKYWVKNETEHPQWYRYSRIYLRKNCPNSWINQSYLLINISRRTKILTRPDGLFTLLILRDRYEQETGIRNFWIDRRYRNDKSVAHACSGSLASFSNRISSLSVVRYNPFESAFCIVLKTFCKRLINELLIMGCKLLEFSLFLLPLSREEAIRQGVVMKNTRSMDKYSFFYSKCLRCHATFWSLRFRHGYCVLTEAIYGKF